MKTARGSESRTAENSNIRVDDNKVELHVYAISEIMEFLRLNPDYLSRINKKGRKRRSEART